MKPGEDAWQTDAALQEDSPVYNEYVNFLIGRT